MRLLGEVDLAAEEGDPGAVALRLGDQLEGVARGPLGAAENADDQLAGIVGGELLHGARAVVLQLQEVRMVRLHHAGERAHDVVVDEASRCRRLSLSLMSKAGLKTSRKCRMLWSAASRAEGRIGLGVGRVDVALVGEGDRVEAEVDVTSCAWSMRAVR